LIRGAGFGVWGVGFGVRGSGCRVQGAGCRVQGAGLSVCLEDDAMVVDDLDAEDGRAEPALVCNIQGSRQINFILFQGAYLTECIHWFWKADSPTNRRLIVYYD